MTVALLKCMVQAQAAKQALQPTENLQNRLQFRLVFAGTEGERQVST
jgi:hypothetical protein